MKQDICPSQGPVPRVRRTRVRGLWIVGGLLLLVGCGDANRTGNDATVPEATVVEEPQAPAASGSARAIAEGAFADYQRGLTEGDWQPFLARLDDDVLIRFPMGQFRGEHRGLEAAREFFRHSTESFPDGIEVERVERITSEGQRVFFELTSGAKQRGQLYRNRVGVSMDVCGAKICAYREYFGLAGPPPA